MKKKLVVSALVLLFALPNVVKAQEWSSDQKEVWTAIQGWWNNSQAQNSKYLIDATHPDYKGWSFGDNYPTGKSDLTYWATNVLPKRKTLHTSLRPMEILVAGDVAVVHYYYSNVRMVEEKEKNVEGRWTDIWRKVNGKWLLYADSGGELSDDD